MTRLLWIVLPFWAACATSTGVRSADDPSASVRAFLDRYLEALEGRDEARIRELFVADGRLQWFTDGALSYATADEVLAGLKRYAGVRSRTELANVRVESLAPGLASVASHFRTRLDFPGGGNHEYAGVITWLLERSTGHGEWRVLVGHTSTPGGPPRS